MQLQLSVLVIFEYIPINVWTKSRPRQNIYFLLLMKVSGSSCIKSTGVAMPVSVVPMTCKKWHHRGFQSWFYVASGRNLCLSRCFERWQVKVWNLDRFQSLSRVCFYDAIFSLAFGMPSQHPCSDICVANAILQYVIHCIVHRSPSARMGPLVALRHIIILNGCRNVPSLIGLWWLSIARAFQLKNILSYVYKWCDFNFRVG